MARSSSPQKQADQPKGTVVYYAPDGGEYPVNEDTLTEVERVQLRSWGYSTEKPSAEDAEAASVPVPDGGPLSGAVAD